MNLMTADYKECLTPKYIEHRAVDDSQTKPRAELVSEDELLKKYEYIRLKANDHWVLHEYLTPMPGLITEQPEYYSSNKKHLLEAFKRETQEYSKYVSSANETQRAFNVLCNNVSELPFKAAAVELTPNKTIKFTLSFNEGRVLIISKFVNNDPSSQHEIIYSFFHNRKPIASNAADIQTFVQEFLKYLSMPVL